MRSKDSGKFYIRHILKVIKRIEVYLGPLPYPEFSENRLIQDKAIRQLKIIGEASRNLSATLVITIHLLRRNYLFAIDKKII